MTYDGSGTPLTGVKLYLNGDKVDDASVNNGTYTSMVNTSSKLSVAKQADDINTYANGKIDDIQIYDEELAQSAITWIYNNPGSSYAGIVEMEVTCATFDLTGKDVGMNLVYEFIVDAGNFILTGKDVGMDIVKLVLNVIKHNSAVINLSKIISSVTNLNKNNSSPLNSEKNISSPINIDKNDSSVTNINKS
jgi:hypothetical protein